MSTFDNPFDPHRRLQRCSCGRHVNQAEHERDAARQLHCAPAESEAVSEDRRYQGVVASAVMRAMFPKDAARRAFLKSVGAATAAAALSQFFPLKIATEAFAEGGPLEKKDLKVGFIPITCATPIIMAAPMGFYSKNGLNVEVIKTAGFRGRAVRAAGIGLRPNTSKPLWRCDANRLQAAKSVTKVSSLRR